MHRREFMLKVRKLCNEGKIAYINYHSIVVRNKPDRE